MLRLFLLLLIVASFADDARGQDAPLTVVSFNIRYDTPGDSLDAWPHRRDGVASFLRFHEADIVGLQEALHHQLEDLRERMPDHFWIGVGRDDGRLKGEFSGILLRRERFEVLDEGTFWLSETPSDTGSTGWDASYPRVATWARLMDVANDRILIILNTHFDHVGEVARAEAARQVRDFLVDVAAEDPIVVTGDFNTLPDSEPILTLTGDGSPLRDAKSRTVIPHYGPESTWNAFREIVPGRRIDYIFVTDHFEVRRHAALTDRVNGRFLSDHLPVLAELSYRHP